MTTIYGIGWRTIGNFGDAHFWKSRGDTRMAVSACFRTAYANYLREPVAHGQCEECKVAILINDDLRDPDKWEGKHE